MGELPAGGRGLHDSCLLNDMRRVPLFVRSARRPRAAGAKPGRASRRHRIATSLALLVAVGVGVAVVTALPRGVVLDPLVLHAGVPAFDDANAKLLASVRTRRERARSGDDLAQPADAAWPAIEEPGQLASLRRALLPDAPHVSTEVFALADQLEIVVRSQPGNATLRSRVARGPDAAERIVAEGAEDVLLLTSPVAAAALLMQDPRVVTDAARRDEVLTVLARNPAAMDDPRALLLLGIDAAGAGQCELALGYYDRIIASHPDASRAYVLAADCHGRLGNRSRALELLGIARQVADAPLVLSLAGQAYQRLGHADQGLALLQLAFARDPSLPGTTIAIGETLLALHRPAEALAWLTSHPPARHLRGRWLEVLGLAQVRSGAGPAAEATATALRATDAASVEATRIEAELATAMKAWPQALGRFGALRSVAPADGAARAGEGQALLGLRRPTDAIAAFQGCIDVSPWRAECRLWLGVALRESDQPEAALAALADAAALDALDPRIPFETARTLRGLLRRDEAAVHAKRADELAARLAQRLVLP